MSAFSVLLVVYVALMVIGVFFLAVFFRVKRWSSTKDYWLDAKREQTEEETEKRQEKEDEENRDE